jgi:hypothetical protein
MERRALPQAPQQEAEKRFLTQPEYATPISQTQTAEG